MKIDTLDLTKKLWNKKYEWLLNEQILAQKKFYSEHGEELVVQSVFVSLPPFNKWFVDVGAFGKMGSNTFKLVDDGWSGIMIEGSEGFYQHLKSEVGENEKIKVINRIVDNSYFPTERNLSFILKENNVPSNFDFLSIDIDGYDYEIWRNLHNYKPNLVCIECNQAERNFDVIDYDPSRTLYRYKGQPNGYHDATVGLLNIAAQEKGYDYLCWDVSNAFYIRKEFVKNAHK